MVVLVGSDIDWWYCVMTAQPSAVVPLTIVPATHCWYGVVTPHTYPSRFPTTDPQTT